MRLKYGIKVIGGPSAGLNLELTRRETVVGRGEDADLRLMDQQASRRHCKFVVQGQKAQVVDLGSANGTWLNGRRVDQADLVGGDLVRVGDSELTFSASQMEPARETGERPGSPGFAGGLGGWLARLGWRGQVLGLALLTGLFAFMLAALPLISVQRQAVSEQALERAAALLQTLAAVNREALSQRDEMLVDVKGVEETDGVVQVFIYDRAGRIWSPVSQLHQVPDDPLSRQALASERFILRQTGPGEYDLAQPIKVFDPAKGAFVKVGAARLIFSLNRLETLGAGAWRMALLWLLAALALATGMGYLVLSLSARPWRRLRDDLEAVLKGDRETVSQTGGGAEVQALAESINRGLAKLSQSCGGPLPAADQPTNASQGQPRAGADPRLPALALALDQPVLLLDGQNQVTLANPAFARVFDLPQDQIEGRHLLEAVPDQPLLAAILEMTQKAGVEKAQTRQVSDGQGRLVTIHLAAAVDGQGLALALVLAGLGQNREDEA